MSNSLIPQNFGAVSTRFQTVQPEDDLSSGIQSSFGIIGYKGKVWSIRYRGEEQQLMREDGDGPRSSIEVVILKASKHISKVWYENGYVEGSNAAPDCFSNNGVVPEPTSLKRQCDNCAMCPHNQWGSRITPAGKQGKACADSKRAAVVPLQDINNEVYGGPMLLRVPAASLQDLAMYGQKMQQMGYPYYAIGTRIQFDPAESFPKFKIGAIRPLTDEEADIVLSIRDGHTVERILSENEFAPAGVAAAAQSPSQQEQVFEQPPANAQTTTQQVTSQGNGFGATSGAQQAKQPEDTAANDTAAKEAAAKKAAAEALAKKKAELAALEAAQAAEEKAAEEQATQQASQPVETDEERELRELEEKMAALKAKKSGNAAAKPDTTLNTAPDSTQANTQKTSNAGPAATNTASPSEAVDTGSGNMASDFEANLDSMLADLLPS